MKLELRGITKRFGPLVANDHIDLTVEASQVHALLGENGAGKTTLMNQLYGLQHPDEGQILLDGRPVSFSRPADAIAAGIGMVHQHFMLVPVFTVAENVTLGVEPVHRFAGLLDRRRARREVHRLSQEYHLDVDPDAIVETLPVGLQQRVEIIKVLLRRANLLILDEPTAVLTPGETEELFAIMRSLKASGHSIVFITHKLKEVQAIADTVTVLRAGRVVGSLPPTAKDEELASMMVGHSVELTVSKQPATPGEVVLAVDDLVIEGKEGTRAVDGVSFELRAGEILGVAGVQGNGQTELCEALMGLRHVGAGSVRVSGRDLTNARTREVLHAGVGYIPEDRQGDGLVGDFTVAENLVLDTYDRPPYSRAFSLALGTVERSARKFVAEFDVRAQSADELVRTLSGGNQQKVILARELSRPLALLIASQPTRGLDIGSVEYMHRRIVEERDKGTAVLIVSSELDEIYALADRIVVMFEGRIVGVRTPAVSRAELGLLMAGADTGTAAGAAAP